MKHVITLCFLVFALFSCSKEEQSTPKETPGTTSLKFIVDGKEYKIDGRMYTNGSTTGCIINTNGNNNNYRVQATDGSQYVIFSTNVSINNIATGTFVSPNTYSIEGEFAGLGHFQAGSFTLSMNKIYNGAHSGTFTGSVDVMQSSNSTRRVSFTGEFINVYKAQ